MNEIVWTLDKTFSDPNDNEIHVLQRPLDDIEDAKANELVPFFQPPSLFKFIPTHNASDEKNIKSVLLDIAISPNGQSVSITIAQQHEHQNPLCINVGQLEKILLTVWRVNNALDMIQVNMLGSEHKVYMQTGGDALLSMFEGVGDLLHANEGVREALMLFRQNVDIVI